MPDTTLEIALLMGIVASTPMVANTIQELVDKVKTMPNGASFGS